MRNELDLHGVRHGDVDRLVENFVLRENLPMRIITGNSQRMTDLVVQVLERHSFIWEPWGQGVLLVLGDDSE